MFIRQSALKPSASLSARSRVTTARRSRTSLPLVGWGRSQPFLSQSVKLIGPSEDEQMRFPQDPGQEVVPLKKLGAELGRRIHRGIDFAAQPFLRRAESLDDRREGRVAEDEQVDVTVVAQLYA